MERIRADFPILYREVYGKPLVYLDNGGLGAEAASGDRGDGSRLSLRVRERASRPALSCRTLATAKYEDARETVRRFLNAGSLDEIIFTRNATGAINLVADSFGADIGEGDEIVLSIMEHHSNIVPWHFLRERRAPS